MGGKSIESCYITLTKKIFLIKNPYELIYLKKKNKTKNLTVFWSWWDISSNWNSSLLVLTEVERGMSQEHPEMVQKPRHNCMGAGQRSNDVAYVLQSGPGLCQKYQSQSDNVSEIVCSID